MKNETKIALTLLIIFLINAFTLGCATTSQPTKPQLDGMEQLQVEYYMTHINKNERDHRKYAEYLNNQGDLKKAKEHWEYADELARLEHEKKMAQWHQQIKEGGQNYTPPTRETCLASPLYDMDGNLLKYSMNCR